jgi:hypothetical protein
MKANTEKARDNHIQRKNLKKGEYLFKCLVPSKSVPGDIQMVKVYKNFIECQCRAKLYKVKLCRHEKLIVKTIENIYFNQLKDKICHS